MNRLNFWKQKIVQMFHDPPAKPYTWYPGSGGHVNLARQLFEEFSGERLKYYNPLPDRATAGADRPLITVPRGKSGFQIRWCDKPIITHPLANGCLFDVRLPGEENPEAKVAIRDQIIEDVKTEAGNIGTALKDWHDVDQLQQVFVRLWRRFREDLVMLRRGPAKGDPLWSEMPADSRYPDHSIWDHLRLTTALSFMTSKKDERQPWLFKFTIGPVQQFIAESRSSRDLWISSFLFSDLIWHAMVPIVEHYGPDCIIYPDLRGNPRVDCYLSEKDPLALPDDIRDPSTYAAVLPNTFTAIIPNVDQGPSDQHLLSIEEMAEDARKRVKKRWTELSELVLSWMESTTKTNSDYLRTLWRRQHAEVIHSYWSAVAWQGPEKIQFAKSLRGRALPAQRHDFRTPEEKTSYKADKKNIEARSARLSPWVTPDVWQRYEWAREVYALTNLNFHQMERGFDYALTHHQLQVRHQLRKAIYTSDVVLKSEKGEKCALCGHRQVVSPAQKDAEGTIDQTRKAVRDFWKNKDLDPEEMGHEPLCAVCAMKRFLIEAGNDSSRRILTGLNPIWAGVKTPYNRVVGSKGKVRVPFPSTATIAAQEYLTKIALDPEMLKYITAINAAAIAADIQRSNFPEALPALKSTTKKSLPNCQAFLEYDTQSTLFPETLDNSIEKAEKLSSKKSFKLKKLKEAVCNLREKGDEKFSSPGNQVAVIRMDGDLMGKLLLGDKDAVGATWKDVIHPDAIPKILKNAHCQEAGWTDLLEAKRLMGPSLHAFISRVLATFSHIVVPWVVEREFSGRLIYSGGDDLLCISPAKDALGITARLQQIFSAAWVIDTDYRSDPWGWRRPGWSGTNYPDKSRLRFAVLSFPMEKAARLPITDKRQLEFHWGKNREYKIPVGGCDGRLLPMMGNACSLSAGIVFGHFKTPLSQLLKQSGRMLNDFAKERMDRKTVAMSHFSRGGAKTEYAMKWFSGDRGTPSSQRFERVCLGFANGKIPARMPYKLRESIIQAKSVIEKVAINQYQNESVQLLKGIFFNTVESLSSGTESHLILNDAFFLWQEGLKLYPKKTERSIDGLLLARHLSTQYGRTK